MENDNIPKSGYLGKGDEAKIKRLIKLVQSGFTDYYEELWDILSPTVYRWMLVRNKWEGMINHETTERLTGEICALLWENINEFNIEGNASFLTWLFEFCRRRKKELLRQGKKLITGLLDEINAVQDSDPMEDFFGTEAPKPLARYQQPSYDKQWALRQKDSILNKLIAEEDRKRLLKIKDALRRAIRELDPVEQYVICARFFDKLSYETISNRLEGNTLKEKYYAGLCFWVVKKLKRILEEKYGITRLPEQEV